jgi:hypothetical protein
VKRFASFFAAVALSFAASAADPVAFVADLEGNATIEGNGKVNFLAQLASGTRLLLGTGAKVAVTYAASGAEYTLSGPGEFLVADAEVKAEKGAAPSKRVVAPLKDVAVVASVGKTATASLRMRGAQPAPTRAKLDYPVDTKVTTLQPELRLLNVSDGSEVTLLDANGKELWKGPAQKGVARPGLKLSAATRYRWTVMTGAGPLSEAHFETASADAIAKVAKARGASKGFSDRVMHALVLQDVGAAQEARAAWAELSRERPDLPELAALAR